MIACENLIMLLYAIIGEGPNLRLFSKDRQLQCVEEVLPFKRVHGIRPGKSLCKYIQKSCAR